MKRMPHMKPHMEINMSKFFCWKCGNHEALQPGKLCSVCQGEHPLVCADCGERLGEKPTVRTGLQPRCETCQMKLEASLRPTHIYMDRIKAGWVDDFREDWDKMENDHGKPYVNKKVQLPPGQAEVLPPGPREFASLAELLQEYAEQEPVVDPERPGDQTPA